MVLTLAINQVYANGAVIHIIAWIGIRTQGHVNKCSSEALFLCASFYDGLYGSVSRRTVLLCGYANSVQSVTLLIGINGDRPRLTQEAVIMSNSILIVRDDVTPVQIADAIAAINDQSLSALQATISLMVNVPLHAHSDVRAVCGLLFALQSLLMQQQALCDRADALGFEASVSGGVENG